MIRPNQADLPHADETTESAPTLVPILPFHAPLTLILRQELQALKGGNHQGTLAR